MVEILGGGKVKRTFYLPSGYKKKTNLVVKGRAKTGEIGPKGLVAETEDWDGRVKADVGAVPIRLVMERDKTIRLMTYGEQVERGYIVPGDGPTGVRI